MTKTEIAEVLELHRLWLDTGGHKGKRADLSEANLTWAKLAGADLAWANLAWAKLAGANLGRADLAGAKLAGADLVWANLARANLARADLAGADLAWADLAGADLAGADLAGAKLAGANLGRADLAGADLAGAKLAGADLGRAKLAGAKLARADLGCGWSWEDYVGRFTALLCTWRGERIEDVAAAWDCHRWSNCPMHVALGVDSVRDIEDEALREAVEAWVPLFDHRLIPPPA